MFKNIIFDLSEVIYYGYHGAESTIEHSLNIPTSEFLKRKEETLDFFLDTMRGKYSEDEYFIHLLEGMNWNVSVNDLKNHFRRSIEIPVEGTLDIIEELSSNNYKLILLSDYVKEWYDYKISKDELSIFDDKYFSFQYNKLKKDEGVFEFILNKLNIKPEETIFIDDYKNYTEKAEKSGITGITFKNASQLRDDLNKLNVLPYNKEAIHR